MQMVRGTDPSLDWCNFEPFKISPRGALTKISFAEDSFLKGFAGLLALLSLV